MALRPEAADQGARPSSLGVVAELCKECRHCLVACPTAAIRVRDARPDVLDHLCIDCTACIGACAPRALTMTDAPGALGGGDVLVVPPALLAGFGEHPVAAVVEELRGLGYDEVLSVHRYEDDLRRAVIDLAATGDAPAPLISPVCPAVVNLIEVKFPSLLEHLAPLASPWEAAQLALDGPRGHVRRLVPQPAHRAARAAAHGAARHGHGRGRPRRGAAAAGRARAARAPGDAASPPQAGGADDLLVVTGVPHVLAVLEAVEDGRLPGVSAIEPYICDGGCFGTPLLAEDASVAAWRWAPSAATPRAPAAAGRAPAPSAPAPASAWTPTWRSPSASSPSWTPRPAPCPAETAACAARPRAPPSPKTSSWSVPRARSARTSPVEEESAT